MAGVSCWVFTAFLALVFMQGWTLDVIDVDLSGPGCSDSQERLLSAGQAYRLHANYTPTGHQAPFTGCNVTVRTSGTSMYLHYIVQKLVISQCGIVVRIYDKPHGLSSSTHTLTCKDTGNLPVQGSSSTQGVLQFSVQRNKTQTSAFQLLIQVSARQEPAYAARTEDAGSEADVSEDPTPMDNNEGEGGGSLNIGVVVGLAIAGVILIIALVGLAIYCCLRNRNQDFKDAEANDARSGTSVFTSGTSQVLFAGTNNQRKGGGGKYGSMEDVRSSSSADRGSNTYSNKGYQADGQENRSDRGGTNQFERGGRRNTAFDESDYSTERGGHVSRRDSGRGVKYDKKKNFSRNEEYEMSKVSKVPNGILKTRSKSPNRSQSSTEGSTVDSNALVYGYSQTTHAHPNTQHIPVLERTRSRSRSRGTSSQRTGSARRSRSGSVGKSAGKDKGPKSSRQYSDMSHFLDKPKERPRSRSGSMGRRSRSDSKASESVPSEVSFAPSGNSSKKNTGGRRVHIQGVETDF